MRKPNKADRLDQILDLMETAEEMRHLLSKIHFHIETKHKFFSTEILSEIEEVLEKTQLA